MAEVSEPDMQHVHQTVNRVMDVLLPLNAATRERVLKVVGSYFDNEVPSAEGRKPIDPHFTTQDTPIAAAKGREGLSRSRDPHFNTQEPPTPKDFLVEKRPTTYMDRVACLAYYLGHYRDMPHFKTTDISKLNTEAAQIKFTNASYAVRDAAKSGYLAAVTKDTKQLTAAGEKFVEALPDRAAAQEAMKGARPKRVRKRTASKAQGENNGE